MALQPAATDKIDHESTPPFLLRVFYRHNRTLDPYEFSIPPPPNADASVEYYSILPASIQQNSLELYQWSDCTLGQLTAHLMSQLGEEVCDEGTRVVFKLIFPDTRAGVGEGGRGKWIDKPLGSTVVGAGAADDVKMENGDGDLAGLGIEGDSHKTLAEARFVIGDYVACAIYPPGPDGRAQNVPVGRAPRDGVGPPRGMGGPRENGYGGRGGGGYGRGGGGGGMYNGGGGYRGGRGGRY